MDEIVSGEPVFLEVGVSKSGRPYRLDWYPDDGPGGGVNRSTFLKMLPSEEVRAVLKGSFEQSIYCQGFAAGWSVGQSAGLEKRNKLLAALVIDGMRPVEIAEIAGLNPDYVRRSAAEAGTRRKGRGISHPH